MVYWARLTKEVGLCTLSAPTLDFPEEMGLESSLVFFNLTLGILILLKLCKCHGRDGSAPLVRLEPDKPETGVVGALGECVGILNDLGEGS
ncbi:hypothetical protein D3C76_1518760 [compost metagenome]